VLACVSTFLFLNVSILMREYVMCEREMRKISHVYQNLDIHVYAGKRSKAKKHLLMMNTRPLRFRTLFMHLLHKHYAHFATHIAR
jgi:hypothetical protein